jgi:hypothetical protein
MTNGHLLTLLRFDGSGTLRTLAEVITPGTDVTESLHALALLLNFGVRTGDELVLFTEPHARIQHGDYLYDGRHTRIVEPSPPGSLALLALSCA